MPGGERMITRSDSILASEERVLPEVLGYDTQLVKMLNSKWQDAFDQLSDTLFDAMIVLYLKTDDGFKIALTNNRPQNPFSMEQTKFGTGNDFIDLVHNYGRMMLVEDAAEDSRLDESEELSLGFKNMMGIPILNRQERVVGVLAALRKDSGDIENGDVNLFSWMATSLEESLCAYELEMITHQIGIHDSLTRLITREKMMEMIQAEFDRSQRSEMPFSLVVIDIDNFRIVNETYGHDAGDRVLRQFAKLILDRIRQVDYACRWDGDAFAVLLPQTEMIGANQLVSDLFFNLTHHIFPEVGRCYFSMGLADFSMKDTSINEMLLRLDKALYRVKAFGGNSHIAKYHT